MKFVSKMVLSASVLASLNACGSQSENKEQSQTAGLLSSSTLDFNLGSYLSPYLEEKKAKGEIALPELIKASSNGLAIGGAKSFFVNQNLTYKSEEQKVSAQYFMTATAVAKIIDNKPVIDIIARAQTDQPEAFYEVRVLGDSKISQKITSVQTFNFAREIRASTPIDIVPGLSLDLGGSIGGEIGATVAPNINIRLRSAEVIVTPSAKLYGTVLTGVSVLFAEAHAKGKVTIFEGALPLTGGISLLGSQPKPILRVDPFKLGMLGGRADLYASLSVGNILPGAAKTFWKAIFGNGLEYTHPLVKWESLKVLELPAYELK